jgi:LPS-assembly lipoprotein
MSWCKGLAFLLVGLVVAGCGFQLRSAPQVPPEMVRTYIATDERHSLFYQRFRRALEEAGAQVVDSASEATAEFAILTDKTGQRVLSVSARNVPREYEVYYTIYYTVRNGEQVLLGPQLQTLTRDYTWDETEVLGKAHEEELMREAIVNDLVRIVLIQLSALEPQPVPAAPTADE